MHNCKRGHVEKRVQRRLSWTLWIYSYAHKTNECSGHFLALYLIMIKKWKPRDLDYISRRYIDIVSTFKIMLDRIVILFRKTQDYGLKYNGDANIIVTLVIKTE